jgi:hypothetical protein
MSPSTVLVTGARRVLAVEVVRPPKSCSGDEMLMGGNWRGSRR